MASTIKVNNVQASDGGNIINQCGTTITLGASGDSINLASGASQTGFGRTGTVDWVTTPKVTGDSPITAVTGKGYFLNTTAGEITINLPAGAAGSIVSMADYAATWQTYKVTVAANGSEKIGGNADDAELTTEGQSVTFVYVDSTQGWINTMDSTSNVRGAPPFIVATGGTPACGTISGDYKIHKFTGPGTFCVSAAAVCAADNLVSYMVVAGGGGGGHSEGAGGGGAGGFRELVSPTAPYTGSPLNGYPTPGNRITVTATAYPIAVGGGGGVGPCSAVSCNGLNSTFDSIIATGGGGAGAHNTAGNTGGSGGGGGGRCNTAGGAGNTPSTTPAQGFNGGNSKNSPTNPDGGGGGGGATAVGAAGFGPVNPTGGGPGGNGATTCISASPVAYGGGGGGGKDVDSPNGGVAGDGGTGGGGDGASNDGSPRPATVGAINTGGGGGGGARTCNVGKAGGSGIVYIRYKFQ